MRNKKIIYAVIAVFVLVIAFGCIAINNGKNETQVTSSQILSSRKIGWGIKRVDNHEQPDLGSKNKELIDKYNRNSNGK